MDIANFSQIVDELSPHQTVRLLNRIFSAIDDIIDKHAVEKIKTIGDSYMAVAGIPSPNHQHAEAIAGLALEILSIIKTINNELGRNIRLRLGISSGPVVAGILGTKKIIYDVWGKTVNLASRIEAQGMPGKIQVRESTYNLLKNNYDFIFKGETDVRGIGPTNIYFLTGRKRKVAKNSRRLRGISK